MRIEDIQAKSIIGSTKVPSADYVINPYTGCQFGCSYCYATFMGRFVGESNQNWGEYVYVKVNAVELMEKDIQRLMNKTPHPRVVLSTVTDPYQGLESKYKLTRGILETFVKHDYQGRVGLLTKSPLVLRDVDVIKKLNHAEVGITITTSDDNLSRFLEVRAPAASARLRALKKLNDAGIETYVFIGPLLPHIKDKPEILDKLFSDIAAAGTRNVKVEYLNLPKYVRGRFDQVLKNEKQEIQEIYSESQKKAYHEEMEYLVGEMLEKWDFDLKYGQIVSHVEDQDLKE